jgi:hypothetical protein
MNRWLLIIAFGAALAAPLVSFVGAAVQDKGNRNEDAKGAKYAESGFALVELFTSEGCSSCPPADKLFAEVLQEAAKSGRRVIGVAFHVDYWDRLGWADPYGARAFSLRQQAYAKALRAQVYTPQAIVNGKAEFVGSDGPRAREVIDAALKQPAVAQVKLDLRKPKAPGLLTVDFEVTGAPAGAILNVAVVQHGLSTNVKRGENAGRTLRHENVARALEVVRIDKGSKGSVELKLPADLPEKSATVIAFVQEANLGSVLGATELAAALETRKERSGPGRDAK